MIRVGQAQAGDQDLAAAALRRKRAARTVPRARLSRGHACRHRRDHDLTPRWARSRWLRRVLGGLRTTPGAVRVRGVLGLLSVSQDGLVLRARHRRGRGPLDGSVDRSSGGRLRDGLPSGSRQVSHVLAIRTLQVFTRVVRHAPIVSGSCRLCRNGAREWVG